MALWIEASEGQVVAGVADLHEAHDARSFSKCTVAHHAGVGALVAELLSLIERIIVCIQNI